MLNTFNDVNDFVKFDSYIFLNDVNNNCYYNFTKDVIKTNINKSVDFINKTSQSYKLLNNIIDKLSNDDISLIKHNGLRVAIPDNILVIGAGGIGSWFLPKLVKLLNDAKRKKLLPNTFKSLTICDGDLIEDSNLIRQNFASRDVGKNKAEILFKRYVSELTPDIQFGFIDKYILRNITLQTKTNKEIANKFVTLDEYFASIGIGSNGTQSLLIINLIDNNESRKDIHAIVNTYYQYDNLIIVIDVANGMYNGQLNITLQMPEVSNKLPLSNINMNYWNMIPENIFLNDKISIFDCSRQDQTATEQLFDINNLGATVLTSTLNNWFEKGRIYYSQVSYLTGAKLSIKSDLKLYDFWFDLHDWPTSLIRDVDINSFRTPSIFAGSNFENLSNSKIAQWVRTNGNKSFALNTINLAHASRTNNASNIRHILENRNIDFSDPKSIGIITANENDTFSKTESDELLKSLYNTVYLYKNSANDKNIEILRQIT